MRLIKMFGLAAIAAVAAMALVGVSSASAVEPAVDTALCKVNELVCPAAQRYPVGTVILGSLAKRALLLKGKLDPHPVSCAAGHAELKTLELLGKPYLQLLNALSFSNCHTHILFIGKILVGCEVTVSQPRAHVTLSKTGPNLGGALIHKHPTLGNLLSTVNCADIINCSYIGTLGTTSGIVHGTGPAGQAATLLILEAEVTKEEGGALCPDKSFLDAEFKITAPATPVYVTL